MESPLKARAGLKVLIVDDDLITLEVARGWLEGAGYEVSTYSQSLGSSQLLSVVKPDVVLLDVNMPALSGVQLARLNAFQKIPVIFYSSKTKEELSRLVLEARVLGAIQKTSDANAFLSSFHRYVRHL